MGVSLAGLFRVTRDCARSASYHRTQIDVCHHAFGDQKLIHGMVRLDQALPKRLVDDILHAEPSFAGHPRRHPRLHQYLGTRLGLENVLLVQLSEMVQLADPQAQVIQLPRGLVQDTQCQARGQDLVVHHFIAHQLKSQSIEVTAHRGRRRPHGFFQRHGYRIDPNHLTLLKQHPSVAPILRFFGVGAFVHQGCDFLPHGSRRFVEYLYRLHHKQLARLPRQSRSGKG